MDEDSTFDGCAQKSDRKKVYSFLSPYLLPALFMCLYHLCARPHHGL
ncbi:hypothetical protein NEOC95_000237 [Neochlamydia sp. AcF95]|nr:hypothetical protein [Neochlamydia sp. AcF95]